MLHAVRNAAKLSLLENGIPPSQRARCAPREHARLMKLAAIRTVDVTIWVAMGAVVVGWFGMNTLVVTFGPVQHNAHFYDLAVVMLNPRRLVFGWDPSPTLGTLAFSLFSLLV